MCLRDVEIRGLDFLPYRGRCCRLPSSRYATKTDSWDGGECFRTISWGRRSMRCYTRYSSSTLVQGHIPTRVCLCDWQHMRYILFIMRRLALLSLGTATITLFPRGFAIWIGGHRQIYSACMCVRGGSHTRKRKPFNHGAVHSAHCIPDPHPYQVPGDED